MRKTFFIILLMVITVTSTAQIIGDAFYIYRNDGGFNAFFREEVDSIVYSFYDNDSIMHEDVVTQVVYTPDSIYKIPLEAIDSVGFVTPETIYAEDVAVLTGDLYDNIIAVDGMNITFSNTTPNSLLPKQGDKIATVELTDKFPCGFFGVVKQRATNDDGITLICDSLVLEEAMTRFYGMVEMENQSNHDSQSPHKAPKESARQFVLDLPEIHLPIELDAFITKKKVYDIEGAARFDFNIKPHLWGKVAYILDKVMALSYVNVHTVTTLDYDVDVEIAGVAKKDLFKKNLLPKSDWPMPWGIPLYIEIGPDFEFNGEFAVGTKVNASMTCVQDIVYHPLLAGIPVVNFLTNKITQDVNYGPINMDWQYIAGRGTLKCFGYLRLGIPFGNHKIGWVGGEFDGLLKVNTEIYLDINRLQQADKNTVLYDEIKDLLKIDVNPYVGAKFIVSVDNDKYRFVCGKDFEKPGQWFSGRLLPAFNNVSANRLMGQQANAELSADISKAGPIPFTVGYTLMAKDNNRVDTFYNQKYSLFNRYPSYKMTINNLYGSKEYKCYPIIKLFGYNMLASPECGLGKSLEMTTLDARNITKEGARLNGSAMDYNPDLDKGECGFFYNKTGNPTNTNGTQVYVGRLSYFSDGTYMKEISGLAENTTYYYCAYYYADGEYVFGETKSFKTKNVDTSCTDDHHPHIIDLGLPSGTKWACCNVSATSPDDYGGYYAWGETEEKDVYNWSTYIHCDGSEKTCHYIGSDICGTGYDVAHERWGDSWRMPTKKQFEELLGNCNYEWTTLNGINGLKLTSNANGKSIFLPAAGDRYGAGYVDDPGSRGYYWTGIHGPEDGGCSYYFEFGDGFTNLNHYGYRYYGHSIRPVANP